MRTGTRGDYQRRIERVLAHIRDHLDEPLALADLAAVAHFSPYHFHRIFRGMVGESVIGHVRRQRLERAARQLASEGRPVTRVAFDAGYESHEAFTRAFAALYGVPPSEYRKGSPIVRTALVRPPNLGARVEQMAPVRVAFLRHVGPYADVGPTWARLYAWAAPRGLVGPGTFAVGVVHDDPEVTPPAEVRYDACLAVADEIAADGEIGVQVIGGEFAAATHHGPYYILGGTYARLCGVWLPASGRELASAPALEIYRNSPHNVRPESLITDVYLPLVPRGQRRS